MTLNINGGKSKFNAMAQIEITLLDCPYRFNATSRHPEKGEGPYVVDLKRWSCSCGRQYFFLNPRFKEGKLTKRQAACHHMIEALVESGINHMAILIEYWNKQEDESRAVRCTIGGQRAQSDETIERIDG